MNNSMPQEPNIFLEWSISRKKNVLSEIHNVCKKVIKFLMFVCFSNGGTCLFDIVHSALWGSKYPDCTPDAQVLFLSGARMLHTQHSAVQAHPGGV
jgi:hypothetical protein